MRSRFSILIFLLVTGFIACVSTRVSAADLSLLDPLPHVQEKVKNKEPITIVGLGDSITTYYGNHNRNRGYFHVPTDVSYYGVFAHFLQISFPEVPVKLINKGVGGETADRGLLRVDSQILPLKPDLVFVMYGANDGRGGWDIADYQNNLRQIVQKIKATGADVILVAPTMSLTDLAWLLPYRQAVLQMKDELGCPVLDGTLGLWPVDEDVADLAQVHGYIAKHFPPNGDDIHPWFSGHVQMGRRLWEQITGKSVSLPLTVSAVFTGKISLPGNNTCQVTITNTGSKPFTGSVQLLFRNGQPIDGLTEVIDEALPNGAKGNRLCTSSQPLTLEAGASTLFEYALTLPDPFVYLDDPTKLDIIDAKSGVGVAVFSKEVNTVLYTKPVLFPMLFTTTVDRYSYTPSFKATTFLSYSLGPSISIYDGKVTILGSSAYSVKINPGGVSIRIPSSDDQQLLSPPDRPSLYKNLFIATNNNNDNVSAISLSTIEAVPCVNAPDTKAVVDAELTDWASASWYTFTAGDATVRFAAGRQENALVMAFDIADSVLEFANKKLWTNDGIELYFDTRPEAELGTGGPLFQLGLFPPAYGKGKLRVERGTGARNADLKQIQSAWKQTSTGYAIEISIPVSLISSVDFTDGQLIGFGVAGNNVTVPGENRKQYQWAGTKRNFCTPKDYGILRWGDQKSLWRLRCVTKD